MSIQLDRRDKNAADPSPMPAAHEPSFAETALRLGGKSVDEARRTGAVDKADDQVESLFAAQYQTASSPVHRAVWEREVPVDLFHLDSEPLSDETRQIIAGSLDVVRRHQAAGTVLDEESKIRQEVLDDLGAVGYWGLLVGRQYGGSGLPFQHFAHLITQMATVDPTIAGLASVHGCIGAVDPVRTFGDDEQRQRFLPRLASGASLSAFALTEPCAGSDLTALRTTAVRQGDRYLVNGEKLFITNVLPGRTIGLVCQIDGAPAVLVVDLPSQENEHFQLRHYGLHALRHTHNKGMLFRDFPVPAENLLRPPVGDGLTIAYHGLNLGRVALCANAAGTMRMMLANMLPWADYRVTYGQSIDRRELVQRRIGHLAGLITACDALTQWCSGLIDRGYRGEMECIVAKIFGSESQKEAAIELFMKTHGGRSFLQGHLLGDNIHEFLAPCIYEGEGEMLGMAFFKSLVKQHGKQFFEPIGRALQTAGIERPNLLNPAHTWALKGPLAAYTRWLISHGVRSGVRPQLGEMPLDLRRHAEFACRFLSGSSLELTGMMRRAQLKLADRQCMISDVSARIQDAIVILVTSLHAARRGDATTQIAADVVCRHLTRRLTGQRPQARDFRRVTQLGSAIAQHGWTAIEGIQPQAILMPYSKEKGEMQA